MENINYNKKRNRIILLTLGVFVAISTLVFLVINIATFDPEKANFHKQHVPTFHLVFGRFTSLFYFTYLTNIFLAIMLLLGALKYQNKRINEALFISVALITVTFIIYWTLISYKKETWSTALSAITSLTTHAINPVLGFIALWFIRKEVKINSYTFLYAMIAVFIYFLFALILYFATYDKFNTGEKVMVKDKEYIKGEGGVIIYAFLDFVKPFFYKGGNKALIILLDILMFVLAPAIPLGLCGIWKAIYKIQFTCILKQCKNKKQKNQQCNVN